MGKDIKHHKQNNPEWFMQEALKEAKKAYLKEEAPIGAVIVLDGLIIARGHNARETKDDATLHAEMCAIRKANKKLSSWRLSDCEMYVTLEPCAMCAGALVQCRMKKLYIGAMDKKAGAGGSVMNILQVEKLNHQVETVYGILENECASILKDFFRGLRTKKTMVE